MTNSLFWPISINKPEWRLLIHGLVGVSWPIPTVWVGETENVQGVGSDVWHRDSGYAHESVLGLQPHFLKTGVERTWAMNFLWWWAVDWQLQELKCGQFIVFTAQ